MGSRPTHERSTSDRDEPDPQDHRRDAGKVMEEAEREELKRIATRQSRRQSTIAPGDASHVPTLSMVSENNLLIDSEKQPIRHTEVATQIPSSPS